MSFFDKVKSMVNVSDDDYYDELETEEMQKEPVQEPEAEEPRRTNRRKPISRERDNVVDINAGAQLQVVLSKPENLEEARSVADSLNEKRTVVLNLESANRETARRILDFLVGAAYANHGNLKRVANSTFIITPYNVDVEGDLLDELEGNGLFF